METDGKLTTLATETVPKGVGLAASASQFTECVVALILFHEVSNDWASITSPASEPLFVPRKSNVVARIKVKSRRYSQSHFIQMSGVVNDHIEAIASARLEVFSAESDINCIQSSFFALINVLNQTRPKL